MSKIPDTGHLGKRYKLNRNCKPPYVFFTSSLSQCSSVESRLFPLLDGILNYEWLCLISHPEEHSLHFVSQMTEVSLFLFCTLHTVYWNTDDFPRRYRYCRWKERRKHGKARWQFCVQLSSALKAKSVKIIREILFPS